MVVPAINGVRKAVALDASLIARIQVRAWERGAGTSVPASMLGAMSDRAVEDGWTMAITGPPSRRHRVLVAVSDGVVVGFGATAPAGDPDSEPDHEGEVVALHVDPGQRAAGHGSRLLAACVDNLRDDGCDVAYHWVSDTDEDSRAFLEGAGWAPDGGYRELDLHGDAVTTVGQVRLHTALGALESDGSANPQPAPDADGAATDQM